MKAIVMREFGHRRCSSRWTILLPLIPGNGVGGSVSAVGEGVDGTLAGEQPVSQQPPGGLQATSP
jgi:NADPH:quinone reductase-like Zn-dependent oxidoreductase